MAEGLTGLVLDVKVGSGAFIKDEASATELAKLMLDIAKGMKKDCVALITDMSQPLGRAVGNSLEMVEALETLRGGGPDDLKTLCRELSAEMLVLGRAADTLESARQRYDELIASGAALDKMREIVKAQHGDPRAVDDPGLLGQARYQVAVKAPSSGYVQSIDTESIGRASMMLGAGRVQLDTPVDLSVGLMLDARIGDRVEEGSTLATIHFNDPALADEAAQNLADAYLISQDRVEPPSLIKAVLR